MQYFFPIAFVVSFIFLALLVRKDKNKDGTITKKGWKKFWLAGVVIFILVNIVLFITEP